MRKTVLFALALASLALATNGFGQSGTIVGSAHDFSSSSWSGGQICIVCHTPHNAVMSVSDAPLWNHQVTTQTFTLYSSPTMNASLGQPEGASKLCLSCHDGTVAVDSFGGATGSNMISGSKLIGTSLANDHPISFTYDAALVSADGGLQPTSADSGLGGTIAAKMLFGGKVECASCHDVHNNGPASAGHLLLKSNSGSGLCLTCHKK